MVKILNDRGRQATRRHTYEVMPDGGYDLIMIVGLAGQKHICFDFENRAELCAFVPIHNLAQNIPSTTIACKKDAHRM